MKLFKNILILISYLLILTSCDTNEPPPPPPVEEKVENTITVTEQWRDLDAIQIKFSKSEIDTFNLFSYSLYVNGNLQKEYGGLAGDTSYAHTGLNEGTEYTYQAKAYEETTLRDTSKSVSISTLSTTSHEIEWEVDTLGSRGDYLNDVWGIDENNVWAVGGIDLPSGRTGMIKWDGSKWGYFPWPQGSLESIHGIDKNNMWVVGSFGSFGFAGIWDGTSWQETNFLYEYPDGDTVWALNAVWGSSPEDVWAVGDRGTIVHWDGNQWKKEQINMPSEFRFWDIHGTGPSNIYAAGNIENKDFKLFHFNGEFWKEVLAGNSGASYQNSVYSPNPNLTYLLERDNYLIQNGIAATFEIPNQTTVLYKIRGSVSNNIVCVGEFGEIFHFNGESWSKAEEISSPFSKKSLKSAYVTDNTILIVGLEIGNGASFIKGKIK